MQVQASINLHELYYENDMEDSGMLFIALFQSYGLINHAKSCYLLIREWHLCLSILISGIGTSWFTCNFVL